MKYLAKAKPNNTLMGRVTGEFLDEYRFRVFSNSSDIAQWKSRKVVEVIAELKDEATDEEFVLFLNTEGDRAVDKFINKYSLHKIKEIKETKEQVVETKVEKSEVETQRPIRKSKYKNN